MPDRTRISVARGGLFALLLGPVALLGGMAAFSPASDDVEWGPDLSVSGHTANVMRSDNLDKVVRFLEDGSYLGWEHDPYIRPTGDVHRTLEGRLIDGTTHHRVRVYYSPSVATWLREGRVGQLPDRSMIVKEMYQTVAPFYPEKDEVIGWAAMVKKTGASHDGWFWTIYFKPRFRSMATEGSFGYSFCLTCHASTEGDNTFADLENLTGRNAANTTGRSYLEVADPLFFQNVQQAPMDAAPMSRNALDPAFARLYADSTIYPYTGVPRYEPEQVGQRFPSTDFDHVWNGGNLPDTARSYITSDNCGGCHDATLLVDTQVPNMLIRRPSYDHGTASTGTELLNLSVYGEWRSSPMGMAGRDPVFFAQLESETKLYPEDAAAIQDKCLSCHGAMGQRQFHVDGAGGGSGSARFSMDNVFDTAGAGARYGALARDGISCAVCHQMSPETFPDVSGDSLPNTGGFTQGVWNRVYGPTAPGDDPGGPIRPLPMENALGVTPTFDVHIAKAELCGTCHTIVLPVLEGESRFRASDPTSDSGEVLLGEAHEQDTYLEWLYSGYGVDSAVPEGSGATVTCQECHMRSQFMDADQPMAARLANVQDTSWPDPPAANLAPASEITVPVREDYKRHTFFGMNLFALSMYRQFAESVFGLESDPNVPMGTTDSYDLAIEGGAWQIRNRTASVEILDVESGSSGGGEGVDALIARVRVSNRAGHRLPSGVGFRRAWVEFSVLDDDGEVLWASGGSNDLGVILGGDGKPLAAEFTGDWKELQPHWGEISDPSHVQIYEERYINRFEGDDEPHLTTSFLGIGEVVKDNRLLPRGYRYAYLRREMERSAGASRERFESLLPTSRFDSLPAGALDPNSDPDYTDGGGGDEVTYRIPWDDIPGAATVRARLLYQSLPPYFLRDRFAGGRGPQTQRLYYLVGHLETDATAIEGWKIRVAEDVGTVPDRRR